MSLALPHTHLLGPVQRRTDQTILAPVGLRGAEKLNQTNLISRIFETWGEIQLGLLQQVDLRNSILGYIGLKDYTMYPLLRPGSVVQVDSRQKSIKTGGWPNEYERPIYFVETRESCVACWCDLDGSQLFLIPGPLSGQQLRRVRYPTDAEIVGRVTGVIARPQRQSERWLVLPGSARDVARWAFQASTVHCRGLIESQRSTDIGKISSRIAKR